jgi:predicted hydrolase (HD superfamily)
MTREEALALVQKMVKTKNLVKHMLAVEAGMRALACASGRG